MTTCKSCRFAGSWYEGRADCRRYPPVPTTTMANSYSEWPQVKNTDWCGEYELPSPPQTGIGRR